MPLSQSRFAGASRVWGDGGSALLPEWEIDAGALHIGPIIGDGEFGTVRASTWHGGAPIAVKLLKRSDEVAVGDFRTELNVLQKVHHPNTTQFLGAVTRTAPFALVTELVRGGSVADWLRSARCGDARLPTPRRAAQVALDTARGLLYLHSRHPNPIVHRDLKPGNLLLQIGAHIPPSVDAKTAARAYGICKVADFGLSKTLVMGRAASRADGLAALGEEGGGALSSSPGATAALSGTARSGADVFRMTGETGSYRYMAPEVFRHEPYSFKVDVYSVREGGKGKREGGVVSFFLSCFPHSPQTPFPTHSLPSFSTNCWTEKFPTDGAPTPSTRRGAPRCCTRARSGGRRGPHAACAAHGDLHRLPSWQR